MSEAADKLGKWLAIGGAIAVCAVVVASILATGTPMEQRRMRIDAGRVDDLEKIVDAARAWANAKGSLPPDFETLANAPGASLPREDRDGRGRYEYAVIDPTHFRVCAEFDTDTAKVRSEQFPASLVAWNHPAGRHCFTRTKKKDD